MGLAEEFAEGRRRRSQIDRIVLALDREDVKDFVNALNNNEIPAATIARVMQRRGFDLDARRVSEYRSGVRRLREDGSYVSE